MRKLKIFNIFIYNLTLLFISPMDYNTKIVIFCYHRFNLKNNNYSIKKDTIEKHLQYFIKKGFNIISEKELFDFYYNDYKLPPLNFLITLDDGFKESYNISYYFLNRYNIKPIIFINSKMLTNKSFLSWENIIFLKKKGINFGNHSANHFNYHLFYQKDDTNIYNILKNQILKSDNIIEKKIGKSSISYAHPYGIFDNKIMNVVKEKYKLVYTTNKGPNVYETDPLYLRRYVIESSSNIEEYLDYDLLPIIKTCPVNGGYLKNDNEISFYFENEKELQYFSNFYFLINKKIFKANIDKNKIYIKVNIKAKTFSISLIAEDKKRNKYIETITVNKL